MECSMPDFPAFTISQSLLKLMSIESVMPSNHLILCCPLLLLLSVFPSIRVFFSESVLPIRWPTHWSFNFSISPSDEYSGLISFRIDWMDLLAIQGTFKNLLPTPQFKSINSLVLSFLSGPTLRSMRLPWWLRGSSVCLQCRRPGFDAWVGKILWRRKWQPTPVLLPGKSHGRRSLVSYSPWGRKESDTT